MKNNLVAILGASGHGKVVAEIAELNGFKVVFFDDAFPQKKQIEQWTVLGNTEALLAQLDNYSGVVVGIGNNQIRAEKISALNAAQARLITLIHPNAVVSSYSEIATGTVVMATAVINPFAKIGTGSIINTGAIVEHDCKIGDCVHVSPNVALAGECHLGDQVWIGLGTSVKQQIKIGRSAVIGAGSVVVKDIPAGIVAYGSPAIVK